MTVEEVRAELKRRIRAKFKTQQAYADLRKVDDGYVSDVLRGKRLVPDWMLNDFGFVRQVTYLEVA